MPVAAYVVAHNTEVRGQNVDLLVPHPQIAAQ